jgi:uncharacterized protein YeaO (DUF488 family)
VIRVRRVHDDPSPDDGLRVLVDRLWPRGRTKEQAALDAWPKEVAPSHDLRRRFHGGELDFDTFAQQYRAELAANEHVEELRRLVADHDTVTFLYGARDEERNHAQVLRDWLGETARD